ncbi:hypothetical protein D6789_04110 [Candidatus Woesearchaeota archaeon]|nr:MAG: hypothetical protein D6789_04110 [Candidatus Woesearchaeota archaeon]
MRRGVKSTRSEESSRYAGGKRVKKMRDEALAQIITDIKRKRELAGLADTVVRGKVLKALRAQPKLSSLLDRPFKEFSRRADYKALRREVRRRLREIYGVFDLDNKRQREALVSKGDVRDMTVVRQLLALHQSSKERLPFYPRVYREIFSRTGVPSTILDIGCGANPYSYHFLGCKPRYVAVDLPSDELALLNTFFERAGIDGEVKGLDVVDDADCIGKLGSFDVCFCFKLLDSLETVKRHSAKKVLGSLNAQWIIVSFPTLSIGGGKRIKQERRTWFEHFLAKQEWSYESFEIPNEVFYIIPKGLPERPLRKRKAVLVNDERGGSDTAVMREETIEERTIEEKRRS